MKVLVVDDNIAIQEILKDILMSHGHIVRLSGSINEAVDEIVDFEPNVIILDSVVNDEDSMAVLTRAHERNQKLSLDTILIKSVNEKTPLDSPYIKAIVNKPFKSTDIETALNILVSDKEEERVEAARSKRKRGGILSLLKRKYKPKTAPAPVAEEEIVAEYIAGEGPMFGRSYVFFENTPTRILNLINIFSPNDYSVLVISSENVKAVMQTYGTDNITVATLSSSSRGRMMDINALGTLTVFIKEFISNHNKPIVIIEDFTDIIDSNGLNHSLVFIHQLVKSAGRRASVAISVDPSILTAKDRGILLGDMSEYNNRGIEMKIEKVWAREVLDSRGNPTVEAELTVAGHRITAIAPSGASTGSWEAHELRDGGGRYGGKGVLKAVENIRGPIAKRITGMDPTDQEGIDRAMIELDGTENKTSLGGNATVAVSLAAARAGAMCDNVPVYQHIGKDHVTLPVPMLNIINGGKHAGGNLKIQECMVIPAGAKSFSDCLRMSSEVYMHLKSILKSKYGVGAINIGDEGGFAPPLDTVDEALSTIVSAVSDAGYTPGKDVFLAIDAASSEFYSNGTYEVDGLKLSAGELADHYVQLTKDHPLISIEDPFFEDDFETTAELTRKVGKHVQIVGDDLFVTNSKRLSRGIEAGAANALLLKVNQIGTVTESGEAAYLSFKNGYNVVVSHRSGESEDTTIADLSVGWGSGEIKTGAPARGERTAKYNRLLRIEEELGSKARFPGVSKFRL